MTNLERLKLELNHKNYYKDSEYTMVSEENFNELLFMCKGVAYHYPKKRIIFT